MKKIYVILLLTLMVIPVFANDAKLRVAVFDPTSSSTSIDEGTKIAVREIISSTIVNAGNYDIVERSLLEKVMQEQQFSNSGAVDDNDATEIGKLAGANKIVLSIIATMNGKQMLSIKMIDVKTANVERQVVDMVNNLFDDVKQMTLKFVNAEGTIMLDSNEKNGDFKIVSDVPKVSANEIVLYLPPYTGGENMQFMGGIDKAVSVYIDKNFVGSGTFAKGFYFSVNKETLKKTKDNKHSLKVGNLSLKIEIDKYNYFRFETSSKLGGILGKNTSNDNNLGGVLNKVLGSGKSEQIVYKLRVVLAEQKLVTQ